jgi:tRNA(fMet)-specific endonuclease VapC
MTLYVLDSDHLSLHQRGYEPLKPHLSIIPPEQIGITIISVEELIRGRLAQVRRAVHSEERVRAYYWLTRTFDFLKGFQVLTYDATAEIHFQSLLSQKLRMGMQDLKIAAIVLSQNAILVTRNRRDFEKVPQLKMADWTGGE